MARENKNLAEYVSVGDNPLENNVNASNSTNESERNQKENIMPQENILNIINEKEKKYTTTFKGFYLDNDIADMIDIIASESNNRGARSKLVNYVMRKYLKDNGYL